MRKKKEPITRKNIFISFYGCTVSHCSFSLCVAIPHITCCNCFYCCSCTVIIKVVVVVAFVVLNYSIIIIISILIGHRRWNKRVCIVYVVPPPPTAHTSWPPQLPQLNSRKNSIVLLVSLMLFAYIRTFSLITFVVGQQWQWQLQCFNWLRGRRKVYNNLRHGLSEVRWRALNFFFIIFNEFTNTLTRLRKEKKSTRCVNECC